MKILDRQLKLHLLPSTLNLQLELLFHIVIQQRLDRNKLGTDLVIDADEDIAFFQERRCGTSRDHGFGDQHSDFLGEKLADHGFGFGAETKTADLVERSVA